MHNMERADQQVLKNCAVLMKEEWNVKGQTGRSTLIGMLTSAAFHHVEKSSNKNIRRANYQVAL